jgi:NADP-dependent 3-hydroxy acid dehydrogenase YdfG
MSSIRPLFVVAGIGNGSGTGAATARLFAKSGYRVALISRGPEYLNKLATELNQAGAEVLYLTPYVGSHPVMLTSSFETGCCIPSR